MQIEFSRQIFEKKKTQMSNFTKIRLVGAELFHADGQTDRRDEFEKGSSRCVSSNIRCIGTVTTQHVQGPDVYYNTVVI